MQLIESIPYASLPFHSKLVKDYLNGDEDLREFYPYVPTLDGLMTATSQRNFLKEHRVILTDVLIDQYSSTLEEGEVKKNIEKLRLDNSFTVTTGHQLCLYAGPAYFIYKIASVINLCKQLRSNDNTRNFIPVFWMATEDHDFEEISAVHFSGKSWLWEKENETFGNIPVGLLNPSSIAPWGAEMKQYFRDEETFTQCIEIFEKGYESQASLAMATRQIIHTLFKEFGLVIIDGNDTRLKRLFIPILTKEIKTQASFRAAMEATEALKKLNYSGQIVPREINLFYINNDNSRQRIDRTGNDFSLHGSEIRWQEDSLLEEIYSTPERFSPNVVLRPLYQETILPNIAYIGGPAEVAYWLQLSKIFQTYEIPMPVVLVRSSIIVVPETLLGKVAKYGFSWSDYLTLSIDEIVALFIKKNNEVILDFGAEKMLTNQIIELLNLKAKQIDQQLVTQISMEHKNMLEGLNKIAAKFTKSLKQKLELDIKNLHRIKSSLFPQNHLQERVISFIELFCFLEKPMEEVIKLTNSLEKSFKLLKK